uniref:Protein Iojap, chloroplastic n=1 Tax=Salix viminalis TaxID=40686 RepID=A0A6N2N5M9_SALVM
MAVSTALSIAGAGAGNRFSCEFQQLGRVETRLSQKPRKHCGWLCLSRHQLPHYYKCFWQESRTEKLSFKKNLALRKDSDESFLSNVEDTDEMFDGLFNKYGKVVFRSNDNKPPTAEVDDDAESLSFAVEMAKVASDVKASDIRVLFVKPLVYWTRFFIIATAFSRPQIDAINSRMRDLAEKKYGRVSTGDTKPNSWTLLDFGDVVIHIFLPPQREFYNLEEFYGNATPIELPFENQPPLGR